MDGEFGKCLSSPLFTFTVGANQTKITVHSSALAGLSKSLDALINGDMIEAKTRHVDWSEVDVDTFVRLCEFAYFRNYTPPPSGLFDDHLHTKGYSKFARRMAKLNKARLNRNWDGPISPPTEDEPAPEAPPEPDEPAPPEEAICKHAEIEYKERSVWTGQLRDAFASSLAIPA